MLKENVFGKFSRITEEGVYAEVNVEERIVAAWEQNKVVPHVSEVKKIEGGFALKTVNGPEIYLTA